MLRNQYFKFQKRDKKTWYSLFKIAPVTSDLIISSMGKINKHQINTKNTKSTQKIPHQHKKGRINGKKGQINTRMGLTMIKIYLNKPDELFVLYKCQQRLRQKTFGVTKFGVKLQLSELFEC